MAIAALDDFEIEPWLLHFRTHRRVADRLDRRDGAILDRSDREQTGAYGIAVQVHGTRAALCDAAPKLRSGKPQQISQNPQQWHVVGGLYRQHFVVDPQIDHECILDGSEL